MLPTHSQKNSAPPFAGNRKFILNFLTIGGKLRELLFRYTLVLIQNKNYGSEKLIVVSSFPSDIRHSNFRQLSLPTYECWRKIDFTEFLFWYTEFFPKQKLWFRKNAVPVFFRISNWVGQKRSGATDRRFET